MNENVMTGKVLWKNKGGSTGKERKPAGRCQAVWRALMTVGAIMGAVLLVGAMAAPLCAQSYPTKPIRLIIGMVPGGGLDLLARIIAGKLAERLGQPVVVESRPGAGATIAYRFTAMARPDGYTIILNAPSLAISPSLYKKLDYDPIKDFAPISRVADAPYMLTVRSSLPVNSLKELVEYAKANPGKLNYGSNGVGSTPHLAAALFKSLARIEIVHVPYKGTAQSLAALLSGEIDVFISNMASFLSQLQTGKLRALAVLHNERFPSMPNVPTAKEAGIDNCEVTIWYGLLAPAGTPRDIVNRLNAEWVKIAAMPSTKEQMNKADLEPTSSTPEQFSDFLKAEVARWGKVIKEANIPRID